MALAGKFLTFSLFMRRALYGAHGYYTKQVKFQSSDTFFSSYKEAHFATHATKGYGLAFVLANYFYYVFQQQIKNGKRTLSSNEPFVAVELSGGNGDLAYRIFHLIETLAKEKLEQWPALFAALHYTIYEISPELVRQQKEKNKEYIDSGKLVIKHETALKMTEKKVAIIFSNEFFDNQPFDDIKIDSEGKPFIKICLPYIPDSWLQKYREKGINEGTLEEDLIELARFTVLPHVPGKKPINRELFTSLENKMNDKSWFDFLCKSTWKTVWVPLKEFPSLEADIMSVQHVREFKRDTEQHVAVDTIRMLKVIKQVECDFQIHFDYAVAHRYGSGATTVLCYPNNEKYNFQPEVDFSTPADARLIASMLSEREDLFDVHYNYQLLSLWLVKEIADKTFPALLKKFPLFINDMQKFFAGPEYKFLCSSTFPIRNLQSIHIGTTKEESYPEHPFNPLNMGLSFNRELIPDSESASGCLNPLADIERLEKFLVYYLHYYFTGMHLSADVKETRKLLEEKGKQQYTIWRDAYKKPQAPDLRSGVAASISKLSK